MSEENVEIVRRSLRAFDRRDRDAWLAERSEDYEAIPVADWPETEIRGRDAAWDFMSFSAPSRKAVSAKTSSL